MFEKSAGKDRQAKMPELDGIPDQSDGAGGFRYYFRDVFYQGCSTIGQQRFMLAHAPACPTSQHKPGGLHERIIPLASEWPQRKKDLRTEGIRL